jgi:Cd2+/Zn2+-exporting ATPase/Cu+-exporting ATPase
MSREWQKRRLRVGGMDCAECALHVEEAVRSLPGVQEARVLLAAERLDVVYDPGVVDTAHIAQAVERAGYQLKEGPEDTSEEGTTRLAERLAGIFVAIVAVVILVEMVGERLGLLDIALARIPPWLAVAAVLLGGYPIFRNVVRNLLQRRVTAPTLMTLGIVGALSIGEYPAAVVIVFFMRVADYLEGFTTDRSRQAIRALMRLAPETAHLLREGEEQDVPAEMLRCGDLVVVRPGERVPADGRVERGAAAVDQSPITGESMAVEKGPGAEVFASTIVHGGALTVQVTRTGADTTMGRIIQLVEEAEANKAPVQRLADHFTAWYIPAVVTVAALTYLLSHNLTAAIAVLLVACACAIALATPTAVVASVGQAARQGILIKGGRYLELLARVDTLVMDKTGTLTFGRPAVTDVVALNSQREDQVLWLAAVAERFSEHPVAAAVRQAARERGIDPPAPDTFKALAGLGVQAQWNNTRLLVGSRAFLEEHGQEITPLLPQVATLEEQGKTVMFVAMSPEVPQSSPEFSQETSNSEELGETLSLSKAKDRGRAWELMGLLAVADAPRPEVPEALAALRRLGVQRFLLLTGDNERTARVLAERLGVEYRAELLPEDKIAVVRELQAQGHAVLMVGDGVNDAPALAQADVGVAMGVAGTDAALEAADVALMRDDWRAVPHAVRIGRRTFRVIQQNLALGVLYNVIGMTLAASGILPPVAAAAGQSIPDLLIMLSSARLLRGQAG